MTRAPAIEFLPFQMYHLDAIRLQPGQRHLMAELRDPDYAEALAIPGFAYTGMIEDKIVGCAGVLPLGHHRAMGWTLLTKIPPRAWVRMTRQVAVALERAHQEGYRRIEATVLSSFVQAHRWVRVLGFEYEGNMRSYGPDGSDHCLYARIRGQEL